MFPFESLPLPPFGESLKLLDGIRVLDLTTSVAAPYATMMRGDLGAEVVKIERVGAGDDSRAWGPPFLDSQSLWFLSVNRNKASVTLDYATEEGLKVLYRLIAAADVVVLGADIEGLSPERVAATGVALTVAGGRITWDEGSLS